MTTTSSPVIQKLPSGVPGLDAILGGGLPEYSFNLIAGGPGTGKTTLAQQILFARATTEQPAIYFTVLGEPPLKMLRHLQGYSMFDASKVGTAIHFVNLSAEAMEHDLGKVLARIIQEVEALQPALVVVDSFRTVTRANVSESDVQEFVQRLALHLTSWQATTFLVGEYEPLETQNNPVFTVADGIFWLTQTTERNASVRRIQITKLRAASPMPGLHTMVISSAGVRVFPRILPSHPGVARKLPHAERASTGIAALDEMLGGGVPLGASVLVVGPSGSGKSVLARQFVTAGGEVGEPGVIAVFEEHPSDYLHRTDTFGPRIRGFVESGLIELLFLRPLDLTVDETLAGIREAVERTGARRLVIDSLSGFELALAPSFRDDFRESLFRMVNAITGIGVTVVMTADLIESFTELTFSPHIIEFLADVLLLQRYVEIEGRLDRVMAVVKTRHSAHDTHIRHYTVNAGGLVVGETMSGYRGVLTGVPVRANAPGDAADLSAREKRVLEVLREAGKAVPRDVARALGVPSTEITTALARLVTLGYVRKSRERGRSVFRADR